MGPKYVTFVESLGKYDQGPPGPVDVVFFGEAPVYYLDRGHPCFQRWLGFLKRSLDDHATIVFSDSSTSSHIASLELAPTLIGVVEEILGRIEGVYAGFTIPKYKDIFLLPREHPQLQSWLAMLRRSHQERIKIAFTYDAYHRRVTSLGFVEE